MIERRQKLFTTPNDGGIIQASPAQAVAVAQALNILAPRRKYKRRRWRSSSRLSARRARSGQPVPAVIMIETAFFFGGTIAFESDTKNTPAVSGGAIV